MDVFEDTKKLNSTLKDFYRMLPPFGMGDAFLNISVRKFGWFGSDDDAKSVYNWEITGTKMSFNVLLYFVSLQTRPDPELWLRLRAVVYF